jgi:hypothetical protein
MERNERVFLIGQGQGAWQRMTCSWRSAQHLILTKGGSHFLLPSRPGKALPKLRERTWFNQSSWFGGQKHVNNFCSLCLQQLYPTGLATSEEPLTWANHAHHRCILPKQVFADSQQNCKLFLAYPSSLPLGLSSIWYTVCVQSMFINPKQGHFCRIQGSCTFTADPKCDSEHSNSMLLTQRP